MYKMIVFDLDGTLFDTLRDITSSVNWALEQNGLAPITLDDTKRFLGHGIAHLISEASAHAPHQENLIKAFETHYCRHYNVATKPYEGISELLDWCKKQKLRIGVLTNKVEDIAVKLCEEHFKDTFDFIWGDHPKRIRKPDPSSLNRALNLYQVLPSECLMIGDSEVDYQTAVAAGTDSCLVGYGFRSATQLSGCRPTVFVGRAHEIHSFLEDKQKKSAQFGNE